MKEVDQTILGDKCGNCLSACLASILEMPITDFPDYSEWSDNDWIYKYNNFLGKIGYGLLICGPNNDLFVPDIHGIKTYHIINGISSRSTEQHSVVGYNGFMIFDPHPSRAGLIDITSWIFIIKIFSKTK